MGVLTLLFSVIQFALGYATGEQAFYTQGHVFLAAYLIITARGRS